MEILEGITEASYLSVPSANLYRKIMRFFYIESEKMNYQLHKEDVFEFVRTQPEFEGYTMEELNQDLSALVKWKNLVATQDPGIVYTIADYKNKQYTYSMSEYGVEIERLTVKLETLFMGSGNLSTNYFKRLKEGIREGLSMENAALREVNEWWHMLQEDFQRLNQNYKDYLREFYSGDGEKLTKSVEFVIHKDKFIKYLNDFVQELQHYSREIEKIIRDNEEYFENVLLERIVAGELEIPKTKGEIFSQNEDNVREMVYGGWKSLKDWFIDRDDKESEGRRVLKITNDIIRNIIQNAALIVQMQNWGVSRKEDYRKFLDLFLNARDIGEAHKISAHVFGIQNMAHLKTMDPRDTDEINISVYDEIPALYELKPHTKNYREKKDKTGFSDNILEKNLEKQKYLNRINEEKELVLRYIKNRKITFSEIDEVVPVRAREVFLSWITRASGSTTKKGQTEYGQEYRLLKEEGETILKCEDGNLRMPNFVLEFSKEEK